MSLPRPRPASLRTLAEAFPHRRPNPALPGPVHSCAFHTKQQMLSSGKLCSIPSPSPCAFGDTTSFYSFGYVSEMAAFLLRLPENRTHLPVPLSLNLLLPLLSSAEHIESRAQNFNTAHALVTLTKVAELRLLCRVLGAGSFQRTAHIILTQPSRADMRSLVWRRVSCNLGKLSTNQRSPSYETDRGNI